MSNVSAVLKVSKRTAALFTLLLVCSMMMGFGSAFAANGMVQSGTTAAKEGSVTIAIPSEDQAAVGELKNLSTDIVLEAKPKKEFKNNGALVTVDGKNIIFNYTDFENATNRSQKAAMKTFVTTLQDSSVTEQTQQSIIDQMQGSSSDVARLLIPMVMDSTSADLYTAMKWLAPVLPFIRILFGVGAILISLLLIGSTILDIIYIGLPFFRERISSGKDGGGGGGKPGMITMDAYSVVQEVESSIGGNGGYKNAYLLYFKRRAFSYILIGFCLLYLVVGELGGLIGWIMQIGTGVLPA